MAGRTRRQDLLPSFTPSWFCECMARESTFGPAVLPCVTVLSWADSATFARSPGCCIWMCASGRSVNSVTGFCGQWVSLLVISAGDTTSPLDTSTVRSWLSSWSSMTRLGSACGVLS